MRAVVMLPLMIMMLSSLLLDPDGCVHDLDHSGKVPVLMCAGTLAARSPPALLSAQCCMNPERLQPLPDP
jgi:hypothetical protein